MTEAITADYLESFLRNRRLMEQLAGIVNLTEYGIRCAMRGHDRP